MHLFVNTINSFVFSLALVLTLSQFSSNLYAYSQPSLNTNDSYLSIDSDCQKDLHMMLGTRPDSYKSISFHKYLGTTENLSSSILPFYPTIQSNINDFHCQAIAKDPVIWFGTQIV